MKKILVINPGSTSTKIALFDENRLLWQQNIEHDAADLANYPTIFSQCAMRTEAVLRIMKENGEAPSGLSAVSARGGLLPPVHAGVYLVNPQMLDVLEHRPVNHHASNLGAAIAYAIAKPLGIPAFICDPVTLDEMNDLVRITGRPEIIRHGRGHNLNMRAAALNWCREKDCSYCEKNLIVAHLGGGITVSLHSKGRIIDLISDDEGAFSSERSGALPAFALAELCFKEGETFASIMKKLQRQSGLTAHLGVADAREVEKMIASGDGHAKLVYEAMALSVARSIAKLAVVVNGRIDAVILTGGIAYSKIFTKLVTDRVSFLAPVDILPGENEMAALAQAARRVLSGEEQAEDYKEEKETML